MTAWHRGGNVQKYVPEEEPHIVEDFYIGNTHIQIADNSCVAPEDVDEILKRIARQVQPVLVAQMKKKLMEENEA